MRTVSLARIQKLVKRLADGQFHSGEFLSKELGVSRTTVWKLIAKLQSWQIEIYCLRGKGYKIPGGLNLIDHDYLKREIQLKAKLFSKIEVLPTIDSTSSHLARCWEEHPGVGCICVAEHQTEGRGRKGRKWISPFGANLYFSMGLNLPIGLSALGGLSLAIGIGLAQLLNHYSNKKISLKWPNDILVNRRKLAGILVEASGDSNDNSFLNIGIGINWSMVDHNNEIDQPWVNLKDILNDKSERKHFGRNEILSLILLEIDKILIKYIENGFSPFSQDWDTYSAFIGQAIVLHTRTASISGIEAGIDKSGAIRITTEHGEKTFFSGEVSLRAAND